MGRHTPAAAPSAVAPAAPATEQSPWEQPSQLPEPAAGRGRVSSAAYRRRNSVVREAAKQQASGTSSSTVEAAIEDEAGEAEEGGESAQNERAAAAQPTKVVQGSVRTGQQVFAEGCSLVVLGHVNSGAEVSADGDIHVYGKLTGWVSLPSYSRPGSFEGLWRDAGAIVAYDQEPTDPFHMLRAMP